MAGLTTRVYDCWTGLLKMINTVHGDGVQLSLIHI